MRKAPYRDWRGIELFEGDVILHPNGEQGRVIFQSDFDLPEDKWKVDYGDGHASRLCLQVGSRGQALKLN